MRKFGKYIMQEESREMEEKAKTKSARKDTH